MKSWIFLAMGGLVSAQTIATFNLKESFRVTHPAQMVTFAYSGGYVGKTAKMLGPNGAEVPFGQAPDGSIRIWTGLPQSLIPMYFGFQSGNVNGNINLSNVANSYRQQQVAVGDILVMAICPTSCPTWSTLGGVYYVGSYDPVTGQYKLYNNQALTVPTATTNANTNGSSFARAGWVVNETDNTRIYAPRHSYTNGDAVKLTTTGTLPSPLSTSTVYYACSVTSNGFQLSTTSNCTSIVGPLSGGAGIHGTLTDWTWTLTTGAASAQPQNPVQVVKSGNIIEVTNGLTGFRIAASMASPWNTAPLQGLKMADGNWLTFNGKIYSDPNSINSSTAFTAGTGYSVVFLESSPMAVKVKITYSANYSSPVMINGTANVVSVNQAAGTITLNRAVSSKNGNGTFYYAFFANGGTLPGGITPVTYYQLVNVSGFTYSVLDANGNPVTLSSGISGTPYIQQMLRPAGAGSYSIVYGLYANKKIITVDEASDGAMYQWYLNLWKPGIFQPNTARLRNLANSNSTICGYEQAPTGSSFAISTVSLSGSTLTVTTTAAHGLGNGRSVRFSGVSGITIPNQDFTISSASGSTFTVSCSTCTGGTSGSGGSFVANYYNPQNGYLHDSTIDLAPGGSITSRQLSTVNCDATTLRRMNHWSGADQNTGFYNLLFNSTDASSGYLIGMSNGPTSLENSSANSGPGMYTSPTDLDAGVPAIGFTYLLTGNGPSTQFLPPYTRSTFLYVGTKADLLPVDQTQGIGLEMNQTKVSLTKLASWGVSFGDPANGWHNPYMPDASIAAIAAKVASDSTYATKILTSVSETVAAGGLTADIVGLWQSNYATASVASAVNSLIPYMNQYLDIWVNYDGKYHVLTSFPKMGAICGRKTSLVSTLLASGTLSSSQKDTAKAFAAVCSSLLWDNDVAPADINTGDGWGTANMPVQWAGWRQTHAFQFASHPLMSSKVGSALSGARSVATTAINSDGILYDGSGYNAALAQGSTLNLTNIQNYGLADVSSFGNWRATCKFVVNLLTPPEPRLGLMRRSFTFGDGGNAVMDYMGTLGTIFSDPTCMWGWGSQGNATTMAHTSLTVPTVIAIDDTAPKSTPSLSGSSFSGLGAMLRTAFNTAQESACMVIGGEWYKDHRHPDNGQVSCYLLRNPIAIDWSPYTGLTNHGAFNHNGVMLESSIGQAWNADSPSMDLGNMWGTTTAANLSRFTLSQAYTTAFTSTSGDVWKRSVRLLAGNPAHPYVHVVDSFSGSNSGSGKVLTWNLMAARSSAVSTPAGSITPVDRYNSNGLTGPLGGVMPSNEGGATPVSHVLGTGPQRFQFTGPVWNSLSSTNSADFDAYINGDGTQAFFIGHWAHNSNTEYRNGSDYQTANGTPYIESQHILRVRGTGGFETLLIPRLKGTAAPTVTAQACGLQIVNGSETTCINGSSSTFDSGAGVQTISTYDSSIASAFGITISGGPAECVKSGSSIACTASGTDPLVRTITPPTGYFLSTIAAVDQSGNIQMYAEGTDATVTFQSSPTAMRSLTLWAPKGGGNARLRVGPLVDGTKPFVTRVSDGASAIVKLAPGTYQAQWVTDLSEGKIFSVTVQ